jgi:UDP-N-acetylmuramoyl-L-alanyl-D-glutamate--2,6-diaminopimelate ligase
MDSILRIGRKIIPRGIFKSAQPTYHFLLALSGAVLYRFPSRKIKIVAITGTKGKTTTAELVNAILEEAGYKTALLGTLRFKIGEKNTRNLHKMTVPGRFFVQKFLHDAVNAKCDWVVLEMTSEAVKQFRHKFIDLDALIFLNIAPEHIESHGSFEKYKEAKFKLGKALESSSKRPRILVANGKDDLGKKFLSINVEKKLPFSPYHKKTQSDDTLNTFMWEGETIHPKLVGDFNTSNMIAGANFASTIGVKAEIIKKALEKIEVVRGRVEFIETNQPFDVVVDYAHTPDSLKALYEAFPNKYKIAILGNTGGGRDTWKRPEMGKIADSYCNEIILTNEDPYDEDPLKILADMEKGFSKHKPKLILDRREAIREALRLAKSLTQGTHQNRVTVLISGKGTDPYIMEAGDKKTPWDDATVVREELKKVNLVS